MQQVMLKEIADISAAFLAPAISIVVTYIAFQQWKTNQRREERELRQSKLSVYRRVKILLRQVVYSETLDRNLYNDFCEACAEADFLFDEEIRNWLNELHGVAAHCMAIQETLSVISPDADLDSVNATQRELDGLTNQLRSANDLIRGKFERHLR